MLPTKEVDFIYRITFVTSTLLCVRMGMIRVKSSENTYAQNLIFKKKIIYYLNFG